MPTLSNKDWLDEILDELYHCGYSSDTGQGKEQDVIQAKQAILSKLESIEKEAYKKVDRFEVIDETGRAYVKGSIYGTPVKVELSYQDDGKTLKVFVKGKG